MSEEFDEAMTLIGKMQIEIMEKDAKIERLKAQVGKELLTRAADALEGQPCSIEEKQLISELRKAAE